MSLEQQGNVVYVNLEFMGIRNIFQCFSACYCQKTAILGQKNPSMYIWFDVMKYDFF